MKASVCAALLSLASVSCGPAVIGAALGVGLDDDDESVPDNVSNTVSGLGSLGNLSAAPGTLVSAPPQPTTAQTPTLDAPPGIVRGGSGLIGVLPPAGARIATIWLSIPGVPGAWQVGLGFLQSGETLLEAFLSQGAPARFTIRVHVRTPQGISQPATTQIDVPEAGLGPLQVSLFWTEDRDMDLHLDEPGGFRVNFGSGPSPSGGMLDLDSNSLCCDPTPTRNENISYPRRPPRGEFVVLVDNFADCGVASMGDLFLVNVNRARQPPFRLFDFVRTPSTTLGSCNGPFSVVGPGPVEYGRFLVR